MFTLPWERTTKASLVSCPRPWHFSSYLNGVKKRQHPFLAQRPRLTSVIHSATTTWHSPTGSDFGCVAKLAHAASSMTRKPITESISLLAHMLDTHSRSCLPYCELNAHLILRDQSLATGHPFTELWQGVLFWQPKTARDEFS